MSCSLFSRETIKVVHCTVVVACDSHATLRAGNDALDPWVIF